MEADDAAPDQPQQLEQHAVDGMIDRLKSWATDSQSIAGGDRTFFIDSDVIIALTLLTAAARKAYLDRVLAARKVKWSTRHVVSFKGLDDADQRQLVDATLLPTGQDF